MSNLNKCQYCLDLLNQILENDSSCEVKSENYPENDRYGTDVSSLDLVDPISIKLDSSNIKLETEDQNDLHDPDDLNSIAIKKESIVSLDMYEKMSEHENSEIPLLHQKPEENIEMITQESIEDIFSGSTEVKLEINEDFHEINVPSLLSNVVRRSKDEDSHSHERIPKDPSVLNDGNNDKSNINYVVCKGKFHCGQCDNEFTSLSNLNKHVQTIHNDVKFKCDLCDKEFKQKNDCKNHRQIVHEGVRFACALCDKQFTLQRRLTEHIKFKHNGGKYTCKICGLKYTSMSNLNKHFKAKHNDVKYSCSECNKCFSFQTNLQRHIQSVHEGVKLSCHLCGKEFPQVSSLNRHIDAVHQGIKFSCNLCEKQYSQKGDLRKHIQTVHGLHFFKNKIYKYRP